MMKQMKPDRLLNQLVVTALTIFVTLLVVMGAILFRQLRLQQSVIETHEILQITIDDLEETTHDLQDELDEIQTSSNAGSELDQWEDVDDLLEDVDEQLTNIERDIGDIELSLEPQIENVPESETVAEPESLATNQTHQLFAILTVAVAVTSIIIAIFLAIAIRIQRDESVEI